MERQESRGTTASWVSLGCPRPFGYKHGVSPEHQNNQYAHRGRFGFSLLSPRLSPPKAPSTMAVTRPWRRLKKLKTLNPFKAMRSLVRRKWTKTAKTDKGKDKADSSSGDDAAKSDDSDDRSHAVDDP